MADKANKVNTLRNVLVIATAVLMILMVVFQWLEIDKFGIQNHMVKTLKGLFVSDTPPAAAAAVPAPPAP